MRITSIALALVLVSCSAAAQGASRIASTQCGLETVGEMLGEGWHVVKVDYLSRVSDNGLKLEDGTYYEADNTVGMLSGDKAILLSKFVRSNKLSGYIYTICAGGFDAWVTPVK